MEGRFFHKHLAFSWEREYRLVISMRYPEFFGIEVPDLGIEADVDLDMLIDHIVLGPDLAESERHAVEEMVKRSGLASRLEISSLLWHPRHT
jgi:hypothetical protein